MAQRVKILSAQLFMIVFVLCSFAIAASYLLAVQPAVIYSKPQKQPVYACAGGVIQITRGLEFTRNLNLTISRDLVRTNELGDTETIALSTITKFRNKSKIYQARSVYIPTGTPLGEWEMRTYVTAHEFPFWNIKNKAPSILIEVIGRCE